MATNLNNGTEKLTISNQWNSQQVADLITKLKGIPEGTGTPFDSTLILWVKELGIGDSPSHTTGKTLNNIFGDPAFCTGLLSGLTA